MKAVIRPVCVDDAASMLEIYEPVVRETAISFEYEPPTLDEFAGRVREYTQYAPWLVCEWDGQVQGYVYGSKFRTRTAYQWTVEVTVYVRQSAHRKGVGRALYTSLFECLRLQGFCGALAGITLPNDASVGLHESLGFKQVGVLPSVGYKFGVWHDVGWWQMELAPFAESPTPPKSLQDVAKQPEWQAALEKGQKLLRL